MKLLSSSSCGLIPQQKCLLYKSYVLPIVLYRYQLWFYNKAPLLYPIKELKKMQFWAVTWILDIFCIFPSLSIEAITNLMPIKLYLQKLCSRSQLKAHSLPANHIIRSLLESSTSNNSILYRMLLSNLTLKQWLKIKRPVFNINNRFNEVFPLLDPFNREFMPSQHLIDIFTKQFSFHILKN